MPRKAVFLVTVAALTGCATGDVPLLERTSEMEVVIPQRTSGDFAVLEDGNVLATVTPQARGQLDAPAIPSPTDPSRAPGQTALAAAVMEMPELKPVPVQTLMDAKQEGSQNEEGQVALAMSSKPVAAPVLVAEIPKVITGEPAPIQEAVSEPSTVKAVAPTSADDLNAVQLAEEEARAPVIAHTGLAAEMPDVAEPEMVAPVIAAVEDLTPAEIPQVITGEPAPQPEIVGPQIIASAGGAAATPNSDEMKKLLAAERVITALNAYRAENNLSPLRYNSALSQVAEVHVMDLAERGEVTALSSDGKGIGDRLKSAEVTPIAAGSLVSGGYTTFEGALDSWKANPVQRERLLIDDATDVGFGVISDRLSTYGIYMELIIAEMEEGDD